MKQLSVAVLGTVCCDETHRLGEKPAFGFGGLFYNLITLAQLFGDEGSIIPICKIGNLDYSTISEQFRQYPVITFDHVWKYPGRNNTVVLKYFSDEERIEYSTNLPQPFSLQELVPVPDVRLYLVNFVSGIEMRYRTFRAVRKRLRVPLFVDLHSIFLGFKQNGERYYRRSNNWSHWHESGDIIHMNQVEAQMLAGRAFKTEKDYRSFGNYLLDYGSSTVLITKGSEGSLVVWKSRNRTLYKSIPGYSYGALQNPTGCGDIYSSAYVYRYLQGADPPEAADFASKVAGIRASQNSSGKLHYLRSTLEEEGIL